MSITDGKFEKVLISKKIHIEDTGPSHKLSLSVHPNSRVPDSMITTVGLVSQSYINKSNFKFQPLNYTP